MSSRRSAAKAVAASANRRTDASSPFIEGRLADNFWIIACPVVALGVMAFVWKFSGYSDLAIYAVLFGFIVTGHHLPGWFRAFGEPAVYQRYKARLWVSLVAVPVLIIVPTALGLGAVALTVGALFDLWHVAMQQHGFGRIYSAKAGDTERVGARLDLACVLAWYLTAVFWSDAWMQGIAHVFFKAGVPVFNALSPNAWRAVQWTLAGASLILAILYIRRAILLKRSRNISTPNKHLVHLFAFAVIVYSYQFASWYRAQSVQNLFHALQYFFMVWIFGHLSIRRDPVRPSGIYRALFRKRGGMLLFAGAIALYGAGAITLSSSGYRLTGADAERTAQIIGSIGLSSLLLHFYVDSFIWKVRSREVRTALAIGGREMAPAVAPITEPMAKGALHAAAYFGLPLAIIATAGARARHISPTVETAAARKEALLFPRSAMARYAAGLAELKMGDPAAAHRQLSAALALAPSLEGPAPLLAQIDRHIGNRDAEIDDERAALLANPRDVRAHYELANALAARRELPEAEVHYLEAIRLAPKLAAAHENLGVIYKWQGELARAIPCFRRAHELDPDLSAAACDLAGAVATLGRTDEALSLLSDYRRRHPEDRAAADLESAIRKDAGR